jgi:sterol desaturase/sphingolipid hydroxylase (fatty acid hydroxylase superfamily)
VLTFALTERVKWQLAELSLANSCAAVFLLFTLDDMLYAPTHRLMHWRPLYKYVHKHHHRQNMPVRGYFDAANEHPVEQLVGLTIVWVTIHAVHALAGLHALALLVFFAFYAAFAMLNHTEFDVQASWIGYSVRAHEMHHRIPNCNFAQTVMVWDSLMGTRKPYRKD